ncbi:hypothetical protein B0H11DRAFT_489708 [Mycena galericulata]|nr:hypothetical protein B0H11DRAFT_489708 [Mycena galericulata]
MALGALLPWNWGSAPHEKERPHEKMRRVRTRAEQVLESKKSAEKSVQLAGCGCCRRGARALSGPRQYVWVALLHEFYAAGSYGHALASLSALPPYLLSIRTRAETLDVPTPVVDALLDLLTQLNTPAPAPALSAFWDARQGSSSSSVGAKAAALLASYEHQDAQEFFQLLSESMREDSARVAREGARDRGFAAVAAVAAGVEEEDAGAASPFDGLTVTRRACVRCGYTAAIRHFAFDSVQLALESAGGGWGGTTLPALLRAYTALEVLHDCACRRCAFRATARRLMEEAARLEEKAPGPSVSEVMARANGMVINGHVERREKDYAAKREKGTTRAGAGGNRGRGATR